MSGGATLDLKEAKQEPKNLCPGHLHCPADILGWGLREGSPSTGLALVATSHFFLSSL